LIENKSDYREYSKFLLKYPESEYFNQALEKYHKTRNNYYDSVGMPIIDCFRNCTAIKIRANQQIIYEHELIKTEDLQDSLFTFFCNDNYQEFRSQKKQVEDVYGRPQEITKGYIQLQYIKDSCSILQAIVKDIHHALDSYKKYLSKNWYQKKITELRKLEKHHLDSLLENRLVLFVWDKEIIVPPPPPMPSMHEKYGPDTLIMSDAEWEEFERAINE